MLGRERSGRWVVLLEHRGEWRSFVSTWCQEEAEASVLEVRWRVSRGGLVSVRWDDLPVVLVTFVDRPWIVVEVFK